MSSIPLPALSVRPPEQTDLLGEQAKIIGLKSALQNQQAGQQEMQLRQQQIQQGQQQLSQTQAVNTAYQNALKTDESGKPTIDTDALTKELAISGHGVAIPGIVEGITKWQKGVADAQEAQGKVAQASKDAMGFLGSAIQKSGYDPKLADLFVDHALKQPGLPAPQAQSLMQLRQQLQQNPAMIKTIADNLVNQSEAVRKIQSEELQAEARLKSAGKQPEGETPLTPAQISELNRIRPNLNMQPGETQKDFDRKDKALQQVEAAASTKAQHDIANSNAALSRTIAQQGLADRQQQRENQEGLQGTKLVTWTDPNSGKSVAGPYSLAKKSGASDIVAAPPAMETTIADAKQVVELLNKKGEKPSQMGVLQLVDSLDKDGKLGIAASRLNSFLAGKVGAAPGDDPRIMSLLDKAQLAMTLSMKSHFGASGGRSPAMLQHFLDLANAKTMNAATLKSGLEAVDDYMQDRTLSPNRGGGSAPAPAANSKPSIFDNTPGVVKH